MQTKFGKQKHILFLVAGDTGWRGRNKQAAAQRIESSFRMDAQVLCC